MSPPSRAGARRTSQILDSALRRVPKGEPFIGASLDVGSGRAQLGRALGRLVRKGLLERLAPGVFMRPLRSPYVAGSVPPELSKVVRAIGQRSGSKIQISGAEAVWRLSLSTQVPMHAVYDTAGRSRVIKIGARSVRFVHAPPRRLILCGRPAGIALAALWYLGKAEISRSSIDLVAQRIGAREVKALLAAKPHMPRWMIRAIEEWEAG